MSSSLSLNIFKFSHTACTCGPILFYNIPDVVEQDVYTIRLKSGLYNKTKADLLKEAKYLFIKPKIILSFAKALVTCDKIKLFLVLMIK